MPPKATTAPLKSLMPFGKSVLHTVEEKYNYAILGLNTGNSNTSYDFTEGEFKITLLTATGIKTDSNYWLLATIPADEIGKLFSADIRVKEGEKWVVSKEQTEVVVNTWKSSDCLVAIKADNVPVLKALCMVLDEKKLIISSTLRVNLSIEETKVSDITEKLTTYFNYVVENKKPLPSKDDTENYTAIGILNKYLGIPQVSFLGLPQKDELDEEYQLPTGEKINVSVPFTGEYPFDIESFIFNAPNLEQQSTGKKGYGGGSNVNVEVAGFSSKVAWEFFKDNFDDIESFLTEKVGKPLLKHHVIEIVLSLSGVQTLPKLYDLYTNNETFNSNKGDTKTVEEELQEIRKNLDIEEETPKDLNAVKQWFKTNNLSSFNWLKVHKTDEDYVQFLEVVLSNYYQIKKGRVEVWCGKQLGLDSAPVTSLSLDKLKILNTLIKDAETKQSIEQDSDID